MPSELDEEGEWSEPDAFDAFDLDGDFLGRVVLPDLFRMLGMSGDRLWGVVRDDLGVESVRFYRVAWP